MDMIFLLKRTHMFWTCHFDLSRSLFLICLEKPYNGQQEDFLGCLVTGKRLILLSTYFAKETTCHACINSVRPKLKLIFQHFLSWTNWACCVQTQSCLSQTGKTIFLKKKKKIPVKYLGLVLFFPFSSNKCLFCAAEIGTTLHPFQMWDCFMNSWKMVILHSNLQIWSSDKQCSLKEHQLAQAVVLVVTEVSQSLGDFNTICSTNSLILPSWKKISNLKINLL